MDEINGTHQRLSRLKLPVTMPATPATTTTSAVPTTPMRSAAPAAAAAVGSDVRQWRLVMSNVTLRLCRKWEVSTVTCDMSTHALNPSPQALAELAITRASLLIEAHGGGAISASPASALRMRRFEVIVCVLVLSSDLTGMCVR
jgi:hypothetical protein